MATSLRPGAVVRFSGFELDLLSGELRRGGTPVKLQPQPAKVLVLLVGRPGVVVSREELAEKVWGAETFVDFERGLNFAIRQIRTVLGDDADHPRFLETVPKRGYRFIAALEGEKPSPGSQRGSRRRLTTAAVVGVVAVVLGGGGYLARSHFKAQVQPEPIILAVLPFDDLSQNSEDYLVDSLTEEMIAKLTQISPANLKVIARTSAMQYLHTKKNAREIGRELGADYILENSIRHEGGRLRITAQLVRAADQTHIWAESYDREMRDLLPLETEVTGDIAEEIHLHLLSAVPASQPSPRPVDPEAHQLYLKGRFYFNQRSREGLQKSLECFAQALTKDPTYAVAYAGMADAYNLIAFYGFDPTMNAVSQAKIAGDKALRLDGSMAAANAAVAYTDFMWQVDWAAAEREFQRAVELDDNYVPAHQWYALYLAATGRVDDAVKQMRMAQQLDPLSPGVHAGLGYMYYFAHDYQQAAQQAGVALQLNPNFMVGHAVLGWAYLQQKKYPQAIEEFQAAEKLSGGVPVYRCALARAYAQSGNQQEAGKILAKVSVLAEAQPGGFGSSLAALYLSLGNSEQALHWLGETAPGDIQANWLRVDPAYDALHGNPRFEAIVARIGANKE